jgi:hypothetical protein
MVEVAGQYCGQIRTRRNFGGPSSGSGGIVKFSGSGTNTWGFGDFGSGFATSSAADLASASSSGSGSGSFFGSQYGYGSASGVDDDDDAVEVLLFEFDPNDLNGVCARVAEVVANPEFSNLDSSVFNDDSDSATISAAAHFVTAAGVVTTALLCQ